MKKFNLTTYMSGLLSGVIIFTLFSFTSSNNLKDIFKFNFYNPPQNVINVKPEVAATYRKNYEAINPDKTKGINISLQQWSAINHTVEDLNYDISKLSGFRIYFGLKTEAKNAEKVSMVYTLNKEKKVSHELPMVQMAANQEENFHQQCPPYCD